MIRPALVCDCPTLGEIHVAGWRFAYPGLVPADYLAAMQAGKSSGFFQRDLEQGKAIHLEEDDSGIIRGFCIHGPARDQAYPGYWEIQALYLDPTVIGKGFGHRLLAGVEALVDTTVFPRFLIWTLGDNSRARAFYSRQGYRETGEHRLIEAWGQIELAMTKGRNDAL